MIQQWFTEAKLGIFVHWGVYAVGRRGGESWPIANGEVSYDQYLSEIKGFNPTNFDPKKWASLFSRAGAKYAVLTTKHHDGVALWPTEENSPSIPSELGGLDLVGEWIEAMREAGLKTGLYFSHTDWSNTDHVAALTGLSAEEIKQYRSEKTLWRDLFSRGKPDSDTARQNWESFLAFHRSQVRELLTRYADVNLLWFDVMMGSDRFNYRCGELRDFIHQLAPGIVINSRMDGHGDYETPEQFIPVYAPDGPWELCMTTNNTWSYTGEETDYKTAYELIAMFCECLGMGGNLLLNVGPDATGNIPLNQVELLESIGDWTRRNAESVYNTQRGLPPGYSYNFTSLNKSGDVIYVYLTHLPTSPDQGTSIKGIRNKVLRISILGTNVECHHKRIGGAPWLNVPGTLWIEVPRDTLDPWVSVLKVELEGPLDIYNGRGVEIDQN